MQNLANMYMNGCVRLADVSGIEKLPHLQYFVCNSTVIEDITPICNLPQSVSTVILSDEIAKRVLEEVPDFADNRMGMEEYR